MKRSEVQRKKKKRNFKPFVLWGIFIFVIVCLTTALIFSLIGYDAKGIFGNGNYYRLILVINGVILAAYLTLYRIDAQNLVMKENDLEDTKWLSVKEIKIAIAHRNEEKINAKDMVKQLVIGILVIFVVAVGAPLLINGLSAWVSA